MKCLVEMAALCAVCTAHAALVPVGELVPTAKAEAAAATAEWLRPGDWAVNAAVVAAPVSVADVEFATNKVTAQIYSNLTETVMYSLSADLSVVSLDELELASAPGDVTYSCEDPTTAFSGTRFVATSPGTYRVAATSSNGVRYVDIPLVNRQGTTSNETVYIADAPISGKWRKGVNDGFLSALSTSTTGGVVVANGQTNGLWWTVRCPCRPVSGFTVQGYRSRNALSPHLLIGARHYGYNGNWSYLDFRHPTSGTTVSVSSGGLATGATAYDTSVPIPQGWGFPLCAWALTNGWTRAELAAMNIEDVAIFPIASGGPLPDACCPYFTSAATLTERFGDGAPVGGWAFSQTYVGRTGPDGIAAGNYMTPCVITLAQPSWACACYEWSDAVRADMLALWREKKAVATFPPIYGGDSSGGIYFQHDGKWVMVSMYTTVRSGPNLSAAVPVLRKLCAQYGDVLKEID